MNAAIFADHWTLAGFPPTEPFLTCCFSQPRRFVRDPNENEILHQSFCPSEGRFRSEPQAKPAAEGLYAFR